MDTAVRVTDNSTESESPVGCAVSREKRCMKSKLLIDRAGIYFAVVVGLASTTVAFGAPQTSATQATAYQKAAEEAQRLHPTLAIGAPAPDFDLVGVDGRKHKLADFSKSRILAVLFTCNHCPAAQMYEFRFMDMVREYEPKGVGFVAIQPNAPAAASLRENNYTDVDDSLESMKIRAAFRKFNFPYLYDGDTQEVAQKYGPKATPHVFIFDSERKLRYEGRIDDNAREELVKTTDARAALDALLENRPVANPTRPVFGCVTKWASQIEGKQKEAADWKAQPVTVELVDAEGLRKLRANPTGKTLMVNFWATWCAPCVEEFDDLIQTHLWYRSRDFELVTVSTNSPEDKGPVLRFLQEHHSAVRNLLFASDDVYAMQEAFDKRWDSGVPYTIVISPDGKVIYEQVGAVDLLPLRRAVLATLPEGGAFKGNTAYWARK